MAKRTFIGLMAMVLFFGLATTAMAYSIRDDATGGDCTQIGVWDAGTKTCTLTGDLTEYCGWSCIDIGNDITLNGNGHVISGGADYGIFVGATKTLSLPFVEVGRTPVALS